MNGIGKTAVRLRKRKTAVALPGDTAASENTLQANSNRGATPTATSNLAALSARSTATEVQLAKLLELIRLAPRHTHELRRLGISHPAGRIQDLEKQGFVIESTRVTTVDEHGFTHRGVARYSIVREPLAAQISFSPNKGEERGAL